MHAANIASRIIDNALYVHRMLGVPGLVGLALIEAHYNGDPWKTTMEIVDRTNMSDDTVRRRLAMLVRLDRVRTRIEQGRKVYAINPATARQFIDRIGTREGVPIEVPDEPHSATATCGSPLDADPKIGKRP